MRTLPLAAWAALAASLLLSFASSCTSTDGASGPSDANDDDAGALDAEAGGPVDTGRLDGGPTLDARTDAPDANADAPPTCGNSEWPTLGHDARRTGASDGCAIGPLTLGWTYVPTKLPAGHTLASVDNALATASGVYVRYSGSGSFMVDGLSTAGVRAWTSPAHGDIVERHWPTVALGGVWLADDGLFVLDPASGAEKVITPYDVWGQTLTDGTRMFVNDDVDSPDGPGLYVAAFDKARAQQWIASTYHLCRDGGSETAGSLALDGGKLFRAGVFSTTKGGAVPFPSGLYRFDAATGKQDWAQDATPVSAISAGGGNVHLVESAPSLALVARKQSDGTVAWSKALTATSVSIQAPVLAGGLVIVASSDGIEAFDAATGSVAWKTSGIDATTRANTFTSDFVRCPGINDAFGAVVDTSLAAATGSGTLVVTAKDAVHVLSLTTGADEWHAPIAGVKGPLSNPVLQGTTIYAIDRGAGATGQLVTLTSH